MELDDVFYLGQRPTTLRVVLGLMEDADNSLETYRWATPALLHAIYTKDDNSQNMWKTCLSRKA